MSIRLAPGFICPASWPAAAGVDALGAELTSLRIPVVASLAVALPVAVAVVLSMTGNVAGLLRRHCR